MLTVEEIKTMKQTNVSKDGELTKQRVKKTWSAATKAQKKEIEALTGLKRTSIQRVYTLGSISVKIAAAFAQVLDVNPYYLTGEAGDATGNADGLIADFLTDKGYGNLVKAPQKPEKRRRKPRIMAVPTEPVKAPEAYEPEDEQEDGKDGTAIVKAALTLAAALPRTAEHSADMTESEAELLLHSLFVAAKYSAEACDKLDRIKCLLV